MCNVQQKEPGFPDSSAVMSAIVNNLYALFSHCLLNTIESDDSVRFVHITYDSDKQELHREKNFVLFDTDNFLYDFTPDSLSLIRSLADSTAALRYPTDLRGRSRFADGAPDAGCLEYVKE